MSAVLDPPATPPPDAPTMGDGAAAWKALSAVLDQRAKLEAQAVALAGEVVRSGTIEQLEGMTLDQVLGLTHRLPYGDRSMLLAAADVLADMPVTQRLFNQGVLSWGQVRGIVAEARRLSREQRARLDAVLEASADLFAKLDPDDAVDAVRVEAMEVRGEKAVERNERSAGRGRFLWVQAGLFGRGKLYGEHDNTSLAAILRGIDDAAPPDEGQPLGQRRADGLLALALHRCDDDPGCAEDVCTACRPGDCPEQPDTAPTADAPDTAPDGPAEADATTRPRVACRGLRRLTPRADITVVLDWRDVTTAVAGRLMLDTPGCVPTISAALLESLAATASVRAVLSHGARPLAVTRKVRAKVLPDDVRLAVKARDRGDRFPGSRRPIEHVHHGARKKHGHDPDFLMGLSQRSHTRVHRYGWGATLDPATGEITFTRGERSWTTLPKGTRLRHPPPDRRTTP